MYRTFVTMTVFALLAGAGALHGLWTGRWAPGPDATAAGARFDRVPMTVGDWDGTDINVDRKMLPQEVVGPYLMRRYANRVDGSVVSLFLTSGRPGPTLVHHTPLTCYPSAGYAVSAPPSPYAVEAEGGPAEFRVAGFSKAAGAVPTHVRVFWSWSGDGRWRAPDEPRLPFARYPVLFKLYVIRQLVAEDEPLQGEPCAEFLRHLVPGLNQALFPGS